MSTTEEVSAARYRANRAVTSLTAFEEGQYAAMVQHRDTSDHGIAQVFFDHPPDAFAYALALDADLDVRVFSVARLSRGEFDL